jgi:hypothetical protein
VICLDLAGLQDDSDFFEMLCGELGVPTTRGGRLLRALRGRQVVLCLDEVEGLNRPSFSLSIRAELRSLADGTTAPLTLVIVSRSSLERLFPDSPENNSPLASICFKIPMPMFSQAEAQAFAVARLVPLNRTLPLDVIDAAWQISLGNPLVLQRELKAAFDRVFRSG